MCVYFVVCGVHELFFLLCMHLNVYLCVCMCVRVCVVCVVGVSVHMGGTVSRCLIVSSSVCLRYCISSPHFVGLGVDQVGRAQNNQRDNFTIEISIVWTVLG